MEEEDLDSPPYKWSKLAGMRAFQIAGQPPKPPALQGYLAHKKHPPPRTLQKDYNQGHMVVLGRGAVSYERGTPVNLPSTRTPPSDG